MSRPEKIEIKKLHPEAIVPSRAHPGDAGLDLYALEDVILPPGEGKMGKTGIALAIPDGYFGLVGDRSSLGKKGVKTAGGIIDSGYRGEIGIILWNLSKQEIRIGRGERLAQLMVLPIATPVPVEVSELSESARGEGGFGSTGR